MKLKSKFKLKETTFSFLVSAIFLTMPAISFASVSCVTAAECQALGSIGTMGGSNSFADLGAPNSSYTTTRFPAVDYRILVGGDTSFETIPYWNFQNIYFGDSGLTQNVKATFLASTLEPDNLVLDNSVARTVKLEKLYLDHVDLSTKVKLLFAGADNQLNLNNSTVTFNTSPGFLTTDPFTINVSGGESQFIGFIGDHRPSSTTINLSSGSTLRIFGSFSGSLLTEIQNNRLFFRTPVTGNVDNATLNIERSNVYFNSSAFNFTNGSELKLRGSDSLAEFNNISFNNSQADMGTLTRLQARNLTLDNSTVTMGAATSLNVTDIMRVQGNSVLAGSTDSSTLAKTLLLDISGGGTFASNGPNFSTNDLFLRSGAQLDVNHSRFDVKDILAQGGVINITNGGRYIIRRGFTFSENHVTFNIDPTSELILTSTSEFYTHSPTASFRPTIINNDGVISVYNILEGFGTFSGAGMVAVFDTGILSPGRDGVNLIGTLTFDNALSFYNNGSSGSPAQSQYLAHLDVVGGNAINDLIQYHNNNVTTTGLTSIKVETATSKTATELDGQTFTIIASKDNTSTGTIVTGGSYPAIEEGGSIPALVNFSVFDNNTNGNSDITLQADANINNLIKHPQAASRNRQGAATLLVNAVNSCNPTISNSLNSLTNQQVGSHLDSIHAEPYSSYMTISLEHTDMVMNTVLNHAARDGVFSTGRSYESVQAGPTKQYSASTAGTDTVAPAKARPESLKRTWMDVSYNEGDVDGDGMLGDFEYSLFSLTIGQDLMATDTRTLGAFFSYGTQEMDEHDNAVQDFDGDIYHLGLYSNEADVGGWDLRGVLGYAYGDHDSERTVVLSNSIATPSAGFDSHSAYVGVKATIVGYQNDWVTLSPELGLNYTYYKQKSFTESGDPNLSLLVDSAEAHAIIASVGANARFASLSQASSVYPMAFVRYEYDAYADNNNEHEIDAGLVAHPDYKQTFVGQNRGEHAMTVGLGLGSDFSGALQVRGGLIYTEQSHGSEWSGGLNMQYLW